MSRAQVGIILRRFESPFYSRILDAIVTHLKQFDIDASVQMTEGTGKGESDAFNALEVAGCRGIIILSEALNDRQLSKLMSRFATTILLGRPVKNLQHRCVYFDEEHGGRLAARHLLNQGHRKIAMVTGPRNRFDTRERARGFVEELDRHSIQLKPELIIEANFREEGGAIAMNQLCEHVDDFTAVFFQNDYMAIGAYPVCLEKGISVPDEVSIMGYDDVVVSRHYVPSLTTVHSPLRQVGVEAAERIVSVMTDPLVLKNEMNLQTCIPPYIVERDSVADISNRPIQKGRTKSTLTARERDCLHWTAQGKTAWEISVILGLSETTVVFYLRNSMQKLGAVNRVHAVVKALKASLIEG